MALRSPTQTHSYWGPYASRSLPTSTDVEVGDTAFDTSLGSLVVCTALAPSVTWTAVGLPIILSLDGTSAATIATNVGGVYIPNEITLGVNAQARLGTSGTAQTVTLQLLDATTSVVAATFSASITGFASVAVTGTPALSAGWYDIVLTADAKAQAFARGLYLTV